MRSEYHNSISEADLRMLRGSMDRSRRIHAD